MFAWFLVVGMVAFAAGAFVGFVLGLPVGARMRDQRRIQQPSIPGRV